MKSKRTKKDKQTKKDKTSCKEVCVGRAKLFSLDEDANFECMELTERKKFEDLCGDKVYFLDNISFCNKTCEGILCAYNEEPKNKYNNICWKFGVILSTQESGIEIASFKSIVPFFQSNVNLQQTVLSEINEYTWKHESDMIQVCLLNQLNGCTNLSSNYNKENIVSSHDKCIKCSPNGADQIRRNLITSDRVYIN